MHYVLSIANSYICDSPQPIIISELAFWWVFVGNFFLLMWINQL